MSAVLLGGGDEPGPEIVTAAVAVARVPPAQPGHLAVTESADGLERVLDAALDRDPDSRMWRGRTSGSNRSPMIGSTWSADRVPSALRPRTARPCVGSPLALQRHRQPSRAWAQKRAGARGRQGRRGGRPHGDADHPAADRGACSGAASAVRVADARAVGPEPRQAHARAARGGALADDQAEARRQPVSSLIPTKQAGTRPSGSLPGWSWPRRRRGRRGARGSAAARRRSRQPCCRTRTR